MPSAETPTLAAIADRADRLFTPPAVAMEVLRLTDEPRVDARALCDVIESDPALAIKLLRVVNSSLYGMPEEIGSLSQAVALVGVQPLKLLVLGFALPDGLFDNLTGEGLRRYWSETLTTATAARMIAETGWGRLGDEALVAGLMQGIGQLALLGQLGDEYAELLQAAAGRPPIEPARPVGPAERTALGFEHRELSVELARRWRLPNRIIEPIAAQADPARLGSLSGDEACLAQSLRLANLLTQLVVRRDLGALGQLIDEANRYRGISRRQVNALVNSLQEKTTQLAAAMAAPFDSDADYQQTLVEAHARLALMAEKSAVRMLGEPRSRIEIDEDDKLLQDLLGETQRLSAAMRAFLSDDDDGDTRPAHAGRAQPRRPHCYRATDPVTRERLVDTTREVAKGCREAREALSLSIIELTEESPTADASVTAVREWIGASPWASDFATATWALLARDRAAVWLPGVDRLDACKRWGEITKALHDATPLRLDAGIAGVGVPAPGFDAERLVEAAERCLSGAIGTSGPTIKSIEVF